MSARGMTALSIHEQQRRDALDRYAADTYLDKAIGQDEVVPEWDEEDKGRDRRRPTSGWYRLQWMVFTHEAEDP